MENVIMGKVIAIANQKGGVGKTTTTLDLGYYLTQLDKSVCYVDMDAQTTLTKRIFNLSQDGEIPSEIKRKAGEANVLGLFDEEFEGKAYPLSESQFIFGATSHIALSNNCTDEDIDFFQANIRAIAEGVDYVLIDCPPMIGNIQYSVLAASTHVVIPSKLEQGSQEGIARLFSGITLSRQKKNPDLKVAGIVLNVVKSPMTSLQKHIKDEIRETYGELVLATEVTETTKVTEAEYFNQSVIEWNEKAAKHIGVLDLMAEITGKVNEA